MCADEGREGGEEGEEESEGNEVFRIRFPEQHSC